MDHLNPDLDPFEALRALRGVSVEFAHVAENPFSGLDIELSTFRLIVAKLGNGRAARPVSCPEEYRQHWREYCEGRRRSLGPRAERFLCWDPEVATDIRFQQYLDRAQVHVTARSLQGLVRACHVRWSPQFARGPVAARIRQRLHIYGGPNRVVQLWKSHPELTLGSSAHAVFAEFLTSERKTILGACESWKFDEGTLYVRETVKAALTFCLDRLSEHSPFRSYVVRDLLAWDKWPDGDFREQVATAILKGFVGTGFVEDLKRLVLDDGRLGDPRLPRNRPNWIGQNKAETRFTEWLSKDDIVFFFEHVLPKGSDPHRRKDFWLQYAKKIVRSRPLLSWDDSAKLQGSKHKVGYFGRMDADTSAFMLDFGSLIAVEFSKSGNACYLYKKADFEKVVQDFWAEKQFVTRDLKRRDRCLEKVVHSKVWREGMKQTLAMYGIRP
jgi:hypothetical protein